ncbi:hypothetical protein A3D77_06870 [Candidatus Gottesmanbacteria bacterium RIFCSPHIGHO2_02_FULL_39_11]|uniref:HTH crp-type domain-containing protein n=1 Tax=Candidatus Gottesmanbacteria bacterium RIFCSPHIGHO2_02_FULL_39_11 TaxID=1798382 RepID=A0A1F5ZK34_9BACT|nr:MAG: hypothetical protein A3D77_06870 [Candidatus Gottesmanbacteria bacterium RIFCSPHIGHO2_02_FULL_39_11]
MNNKIINKLDDFFEKFSFCRYKKGQILINAGEEPSGIFYLKNGTVRQYSLSKNGDEQTLTIYKPYSFFPLMHAINNIRNTYFFQATSDAELYKAPQRETIRFLKEEPEVMYDLISRLYQGIEGLLSRIEYLMFGSAYEKVIFTLLNLSYRFGEENMSNLDVNLHITHKDIGSFSGLRKETISREMAKLQRKKILENKNHLIIIKDMERLQGELEGRVI